MHRLARRPCWSGCRRARVHAELRQAPVEVAALGVGGGEAAAARYAAAASSVTVEPAQQVGAGRGQQVVTRRARPDASSASTSAARPRDRRPSPTATARFSSTTGEPRHPRQLAVERGDLDPVGVGRASGAVAWHAAIAACTWYGPGWPRRSARVEHGRPLRRSGRGPTGCGPAPRAARGRPSRRHAPSRRASCSSIEREQPERLGLVGHQVDERAAPAGSPRRTAPPARRSAPAVAAYPSLNSR